MPTRTYNHGQLAEITDRELTDLTQKWVFDRTIQSPQHKNGECGDTCNHFCFEFTGEKNDKGYGRLREQLDGERLVHRIAIKHYGNLTEIPEGLVVDHICRNRSCIAKGHLRITTISENNRNRGASGIVGHKGVSMDRGFYAVRLYREGEGFYLGRYEDLHEASIHANWLDGLLDSAPSPETARRLIAERRQGYAEQVEAA